MLAPADMPQMSVPIVDAILAAHDPLRPAILVPVLAGRRGHPTLFPWALVHQVQSLAPDEGVSALLRRNLVREVPIADAAAGVDIDTPQQYQAYR
jgi:CTP:molybdopterin cytidylyltransferase MocA